MSKRKKYILVFSVSIILCLLSFSVYINYSRIRYSIDLVRGYGISVISAVFPKSDERTIIVPEQCRRYIKTYKKLPADFFHSGHILFYRAGKEISVNEVAKRAIIFTHFYKTYKLRKTISEYNGLQRHHVKKGEILYIPYSLPPLLQNMSRNSKPTIKFARGIYYTGNSIGDERIIRQIDSLIKSGINTIVFDAKDITGIVNYLSHTPDVIEYDTHAKRTIDDVDKLIRILKHKGIFVIARIAVFHDHIMYRKKPDWAIRSKKDGGYWNPKSKEKWCDPTNRNVQDYNIDIALELAEKGVDEIQFDYIRFPTSGKVGDARYAYDFGKMTNEDAITGFLKRAYFEISKRKTLVSIDVFGVVAWGKEVDIRKTGQRIGRLARYCDVISPMLYPSHFNDDFDGYENPGDNPYHFIFQGCKKVIAKANGTVVRPWLQAFKWRTRNYGRAYLLKQIKASNESGASGYLFWNASNRYETVIKTVRETTASKKYAARRQEHNEKNQ